MTSRPTDLRALLVSLALLACDSGGGAEPTPDSGRTGGTQADSGRAGGTQADAAPRGGDAAPRGGDEATGGRSDARGSGDPSDARPPDTGRGLDAAADATATPDGEPTPDAADAADAAAAPDAGGESDATPAQSCPLNRPTHVLGPNGGALELVFAPGEGATSSPACGAGNGIEHFVAVPLAGPARVEARLASPSGGVQLSARTECDAPATELACDAPAFDNAALRLDVDGAQTLYFVAEGGPFEPAVRAQLRVTVWPPEVEPPPDRACPAADGPIVAPALGGRIAIDTRGKADVFPSCLGDGFAGSPEQVVLLKLEVPSRLRAQTSHTVQDTVLGLWEACDPETPARSCDDDSGAGTLSLLERPRLEPGFWYLSVEAVAGANGPDELVCDLDLLVAPLPLEACADAFDNDADGTLDAEDPGCSSAADTDETDPAMRADCADGLDNDGDGATDHGADPDCPYAGANAEVGQCGPGVSVWPLALDGTPTRVEAAAGLADFEPAGAFPCGPAGGLVQFFALTLPERSRIDLVVEDGAGRPPVTVAAFDTCDADAAALACRPPLSVSPLRLDDHPGGTVFFAVRTLDAAADPAHGQWTVRALVESLVRACNDGLDGDADGFTDLFDPGCAYDADNDESNDPDPASWPVCADERDNDDDGLIDFPSDPECVAAGGVSEEPSCSTDVPLLRMRAPGGRLTLRTEGRDHYQATCGNPTGPEQVVAVRVDVPSDLSIVVENNDYDTVVFVRAACDEAQAELGCNDDTNGLASVVTLTGLSPGTYFVFLDGYAGASGNADLVVTLTPTGAMQ